MTHSYRFTKLAAASVIGALALTSCGGDAGGEEGGGGDGGEVNLRFSWWGSDARHQATEAAIDVFNETHEGITVEGEYGEWGGYWDQLATQTAGNNAPDIIQMDDKYLREYADRGSLLELSDVDTSEFDEGAVDNGRTEDGLFGITTGINSLALVTNPDVIAEAGLEMPDDTSWTWEDFAEMTAAISESGDGVYGTNNPNEPGSFQVWLRQQGTNFTTEEGGLGFDEAQATEYFQYHLDLVNNGMASPSELSENQGAGPDQSMMGTGTAAMASWWTNQLGGLSDASGADLELLRFPTESGDPMESGMWYKSSMLMSASAGTDHPEEVKTFIDWFVNSEEAADFNGFDRGLPANASIRDYVLEDAGEADQKTADFILDIESEVEAQSVEPVPALGFSALQEILYRYESEVFFENMTPEEAAESMIPEMESALG
ncbi:ABC transporter substrate-binding protein [Nesterenkonia sandarakina]|uniref:Multiple sugar transport system substrate-binding protein n=1 Tax=Nesterenkonia sandarakina TaxID=272918 RepID=A0A7Z0E766_9MICC|nr:extracellular solute-binding protein [Nesterenkonia sandarakina]NYJ16331.1 multiple sugar transport system substrate-binding protein [Nesterenkonia sandarakina]